MQNKGHHTHRRNSGIDWGGRTFSFSYIQRKHFYHLFLFLFSCNFSNGEIADLLGVFAQYKKSHLVFVCSFAEKNG